LNTKPNIAIVILNWNGRNFLEKFLPSVIDSIQDNAALFVADNHSSDDSIAYLESIGFKTYDASDPFQVATKNIIQLPQNFGFAKGYNLALDNIKGADYFILLNSDVEVDKNWISPIIELMDKDPQIGAAMPKIKMYDQKNLFEYAGAAGGWMDSLGYPFCRGRIFGELEEDNGQYNEAAEIFWASGAALFVRAELFLKLGGFDEDYFAHMEEIDFCWRLKKANYKIIYCPDATVWHVGGGTLPQDNPRKDYLNFRNSLTTLLKNKETASTALGSVFVRLILDGFAGMLFLSKGKFPHILAIIKAHWNFFGEFFKHWKKRRLIKTKIDDIAFDKQAKFNSAGLYKGSIVFQHYIKKVKFFKDLNIDK
jgi:GT2 family glycosyltransferase